MACDLEIQRVGLRCRRITLDFFKENQCNQQYLHCRSNNCCKLYLFLVNESKTNGTVTYMSELKKILYVEDEADIQAVARLALESVGGFEVHTCDNGQAALDSVIEFAPDLILLDVMMPGMDGPSTLKSLHEIPQAKDIPIIFMTAKVQAIEIAAYKEIGALDVIPKPFDPMKLSDQVTAIWQQQQNQTGTT